MVLSTVYSDIMTCKRLLVDSPHWEKVSNADLWLFLCHSPDKHTAEQIIKVLWFETLWRLCDVTVLHRAVDANLSRDITFTTCSSRFRWKKNVWFVDMTSFKNGKCLFMDKRWHLESDVLVREMAFITRNRTACPRARTSMQWTRVVMDVCTPMNTEPGRVSCLWKHGTTRQADPDTPTDTVKPLIYNTPNPKT